MGAQGRECLLTWSYVMMETIARDPSPPGQHVMPSLLSPGLMGRAIPEQHSPHLKEQHHTRGSITQGTIPQAEHRLGFGNKV